MTKHRTRAPEPFAMLPDVWIERLCAHPQNAEVKEAVKAEMHRALVASFLRGSVSTYDGLVEGMTEGRDGMPDWEAVLRGEFDDG